MEHERCRAFRKAGPHGAAGRYLFTRIDLDRVPPEALPLDLRIAARIGDAHFVSELRAAGGASGRIYFTHQPRPGAPAEGSAAAGR